MNLVNQIESPRLDPEPDIYFVLEIPHPDPIQKMTTTSKELQAGHPKEYWEFHC
jgi:hypothetical protein